MAADESEIPLLSRNFSKIKRLRILRNRGMIVPTDGRPKRFLKQISILTKTIHDNVGAQGAIKHYIEEHGSVP